MEFIRLSELSTELQQRIHRELATRDTPERRDEAYLLSYRDAAVLYGYEYGSIRYYVHKGLLRTIRGHNGMRCITHAEMRRFIASRKGGRRAYGRNAQAIACRTNT